MSLADKGQDKRVVDANASVSAALKAHAQVDDLVSLLPWALPQAREDQGREGGPACHDRNQRVLGRGLHAAISGAAVLTCGSLRGGLGELLTLSELSCHV